MGYTFEPKQRSAKAFGTNMPISAKKAGFLCRVIRRKKLSVVKKLLDDLAEERRDLDGKYYTSTAAEMLKLLKSCEANAKNLGLDSGRLFVHASAHNGPNMRRPRRKGKFGSLMKMANIEMILIEKGKAGAAPKKKELSQKAKAEISREKVKAATEKVVEKINKEIGEKKIAASHSHDASEKTGAKP